MSTFCSFCNDFTLVNRFTCYVRGIMAVYRDFGCTGGGVFSCMIVQQHGVAFNQYRMIYSQWRSRYSCLQNSNSSGILSQNYERKSVSQKDNALLGSSSLRYYDNGLFLPPLIYCNIILLMIISKTIRKLVADLFGVCNQVKICTITLLILYFYWFCD